MAPRKAADGKTATKKKTKEKVVKPKLKTPTVIKVKIPKPNSIVKVNTEDTAMSPKKTPKPKKNKNAEKAMAKIDLANEVAQSQLGRPKLVVPKEDPVQNEEKKQPKKRVRKKKVETPPTSSIDSDDVFEPSSPVKKKVRKEIVTKKKPAAIKTTNVKKMIKKTSKVTEKSEENTETKPKRLSLKKKSPSKAPDKTANSKLSNIKGKLEDITDDVLRSSLDIEDKQPSLPEQPGFIDSRKTSINSDQLSWTKDISSSSTTTCVTACSTDFVRYDKKLPIVKLDTSELMAKLETQKLYLSSSSDSSRTNAPSKPNSETPDVECQSLDLSTSSVTPRSVSSSLENGRQNNIINDKINKTSAAVDKLTSMLKEFDLEIINWIGYEKEDVSVDMTKKIQGKILQVLKEESEVISHCQGLKKVLSGNIQPEKVNDKNTYEVPVDEGDDNIDDLKDFDVNDEEDVNESSPNLLRTDDGVMTSGRVRYKSIDQNYDDDDALSLFAESITGLDTSGRNSVAASVCNVADIEEYVPTQLEIDKWTAKTNYEPTKISNSDIPNWLSDMKTKTVCEKQNADSTSIKDTEQDRFNTVPVEKPAPPQKVIFNPLPKVPIRSNVAINKVVRRPNFICYSFKQAPGRKSTILRDICFYNLLKSCKKIPNLECHYRHEVPTLIEIASKLTRLSEDVFIQEYMLFREWPTLRRQYGICFVTECSRRDLTRILVEMAIDFTVKAVKNVREDEKLQIEVKELVLLHLNNVNLDTCEDLLTFSIPYKGKNEPLCDLFMKVIADTQNFSRFKPVFLKLTMFNLTHGMTFQLEVATQILERIAILPCEQPLLEALLEIVRHTDPKILENPMMVHFEKQLSSDLPLLEELLKLKREQYMCRPVLNNLYQSSPHRFPEIEPLMSVAVMPPDREKRYTSPDTTNLDNMNKTAEEPLITPTVEFNRAHLLPTIQRTFSNSNSSNSSEEFSRPPVPKNNYKWRNTGYQHMRGTSSMRHSPRPGGRYLKRFRGVSPTFRGLSPANFLRRSGPDFY